MKWMDEVGNIGNTGQKVGTVKMLKLRQMTRIANKVEMVKVNKN
jgi:hypothetical protein